MTAAQHGRGKPPSPLRALFASLLRRSQPAPETEPEPAAPVPDSPAPEALQPVRMLRAPEPELGPAQAPAQALVPVTARQGGFFEPPGSWRNERAVFTQDFIAKFHEAMRRAGLTARDPLTPVLTMLGEMLVHFTHLKEDQATDAERNSNQLTGQMRDAVAQGQATITDAAQALGRVMAHNVQRVETATDQVRKQREDVQATFQADTEALLLRTVVQQSRTRTWCDRLRAWSMIAIVGSGGVILGSLTERQRIMAEIQASGPALMAAAMRDGPDVASAWLTMMRWNHFLQMIKHCGPQEDGRGYRMACSYVAWADEPLNAPPPRAP